MECKNGVGDGKEEYTVNGNISPSPEGKKDSRDFNDAKNIDDISTPSELKFDPGTTYLITK